jgi:hypothetical protein
MKLLAVGLTFFNASTVCALVAGMVGDGLSRGIAVMAIVIGLIAAFIAYRFTENDSAPRAPEPTVPESSGLSMRARKRLAKQEQRALIKPPAERYRSVWFWLLVTFFTIFAVRSFCWLIYIDGNELKVQSPNNLGDLSLHLTYIRQFASGVALWPDNPIHALSKLRYPAGTDLFNAVLTCLGIDVTRGLVWTGLLACAATCYALYRWAGSFGIAAFLFNGGVASYPFLKTHDFLDYQGVNTIAWKSLPLAMLVTQRGLLYALPAGLLLLYQWRAKFFPANQEATVPSAPATQGERQEGAMEAATPLPRAPLPFWLELSLYATMPLFHVHTFIALTLVLIFLFFFTGANAGKQLVLLVGAALIPASFFVWVISDNFHAGSVMEWQPGWVQKKGEFAMPFLRFWLLNFGAWVPLVLFFIGITAVGAWKMYRSSDFKMPAGLAFLAPAAAFLFLAFLVKTRAWEGSTLRLIVVCLLIVPLAVVIGITAWKAWKRYRGSTTTTVPSTLVFLVSAGAIFFLGYLVKLAPWEWDNIKIIIWAYLVVLPFLWTDLISRWPLPLRAIVCIALFASGFVTLFGGLAAGRTGHGIADRGELDAIGNAVRKLPTDARYAGYATYNHPILLQGRKMVLGYAGHLWTQGFNTSEIHSKLQALLQGAPNWKENARFCRARYLFWGKEEKTNYRTSTKPWEKESLLVAQGDWGAIYDLEAPARAPQIAQPSAVPGQ